MQSARSVTEKNCSVNHNYSVAKKEMKHRVSLAMTELATQHPPDLPDSAFLVYPKEQQDEGGFLDFSRFRNYTQPLHNHRSETETQST